MQVLRTVSWEALPFSLVGSSLSLMMKGAEGNMRRTILLLATVGVALLFACSVAFGLGFGSNAFSVAQAQTTDQQTPVGESGPTAETTMPPEGIAGESAQQDQPQVEGAPGSAQGQGVAMRPEQDPSQAPAEPQGKVKTPPLGLTERGKAALEQARRGNAQPAERPTIDTQPLPPGPSANGPENNEPQPDTPALGTTFQGMADTGWFPPDEQVAAGPNNIVVATNGGVNILSKRGTSL